jgi:hypothetical protein
MHCIIALTRVHELSVHNYPLDCSLRLLLQGPATSPAPKSRAEGASHSVVHSLVPHDR